MPLIDRGHRKEFKTALRSALSTLVEGTACFRCPSCVRLLPEARQATVKMVQRSEASMSTLEHLLNEARQLEMAELLGYGKRKDFEPLCMNSKKIRKETGGRLRERLAQLRCQARRKTSPVVLETAGEGAWRSPLCPRCLIFYFVLESLGDVA